MMGWGNHGYGMWGMGGFGWIMMILFWGGVIVGMFLLIRSLSSGSVQSIRPGGGTIHPEYGDHRRQHLQCLAFSRYGTAFVGL